MMPVAWSRCKGESQVISIQDRLILTLLCIFDKIELTAQLDEIAIDTHTNGVYLIIETCIYNIQTKISQISNMNNIEHTQIAKT
ncbi:hypothetical protein JHK85_004515 [Glycine max]|uniref:Uncharacterized protein n=2 Tax=Glycine subgen. Soja TaxID=1462606 RepID=A0A0R0L832_SOYBN|nr:hypothetical protein JHK85_004515 [Glycine max]KAH1060646.1 hypothetical protein GYH30_004217 [Glycine max]